MMQEDPQRPLLAGNVAYAYESRRREDWRRFFYFLWGLLSLVIIGFFAWITGLWWSGAGKVHDCVSSDLIPEDKLRCQRWDEQKCEKRGYNMVNALLFLTFAVIWFVHVVICFFVFYARGGIASMRSMMPFFRGCAKHVHTYEFVWVALSIVLILHSLGSLQLMATPQSITADPCGNKHAKTLVWVMWATLVLILIKFVVVNAFVYNYIRSGIDGAVFLARDAPSASSENEQLHFDQPNKPYPPQQPSHSRNIQQSTLSELSRNGNNSYGSACRN